MDDNGLALSLHNTTLLKEKKTCQVATGASGRKQNVKMDLVAQKKADKMWLDKIYGKQ